MLVGWRSGALVATGATNCLIGAEVGGGGAATSDCGILPHSLELPVSLQTYEPYHKGMNELRDIHLYVLQQKMGREMKKLIKEQ
jgi:hypothetical protein